MFGHRVSSALFLLASLALGSRSSEGAIQSFTPPGFPTTKDLTPQVSDRSGHMWFATRNGAYRFDGLTWERFTKAEGLASDTVAAIVEDAAGTIWIQTLSANFSGYGNVDPGGITGLSRYVGGQITTFGAAEVLRALGRPEEALSALAPL